MTERLGYRVRDTKDIGVFTCHRAESSSNVNMRIGYRIRLLTPKVDLTKEEKISYIESEHIFTFNEIERAIQRYYIDLDEAEPGYYGSDNKILIGYANPRTYLNKSYQMTTRFAVRFKTKNLESIQDGVHLGLFTAREMSRSMERVEWLHRCRRTWWSKFLHWIRN